MTSATRILLSRDRPVVADCRWECSRRMGVGDKIVTIGALQALQRAGFEVCVLCNAKDLDLFSAAGFGILPANWLREAQGIPMRDHCMAIPIGSTKEECDEVDMEMHPVQRVLWNLGLEAYAPETPQVWLKFHHAPTIRCGPAIWMPSEVSRKAYAVGVKDWAKAIAPLQGRVEAWCHPAEVEAVRRTVESVSALLGRKILLVANSSIAEWGKAIERAFTAIVGNSGGFWMAAATGTQCRVLQRRWDGKIPHQLLWTIKPGWLNGVHIIDLPHG